jgi:hypothetical protein
MVNNKKITVKIKKNHWTSILNCLLLRVFLLFHYAFKMKKNVFSINLVITSMPCKKTLMSPIINLIFFLFEGQKH